MIKKILILVIALVMFFLACGAQAMDYDEWVFERFLWRYVSDGTIDYLKWKSEDFESYEEYIASLAKVNLIDWSKDEQKAFWINAYNALTIYGVLKVIPPHSSLALFFSVQMIPGFFDKTTYKVAGEKLTLDQIEHQKLRDQFQDPRIHFAIVSASMSCPKIQENVLRAAGLNERLDELTRFFIQDKKRNRLDQQHNVLYLSKIFQWFRLDFEEGAGSVIAFLRLYMSETDNQHFLKNAPSIKYRYYNWLVNIQSERGYLWPLILGATVLLILSLLILKFKMFRRK